MDKILRKINSILFLLLIIFTSFLPLETHSSAIVNKQIVDNIDNIKKEEEIKPKKEEVVVSNNTYLSSNNNYEESNSNNITLPSSVKGNISISNSDFNSYLTLDDSSYYYLNHDIYGNPSSSGSLMVDFRSNFNGRKTIIYGHSLLDGSGPFNYLQNYHNNYGFYNNHKYIYVNYGGINYTYLIFSVYVQTATSDYDEGLEYFYNIDYDSPEEYQYALDDYKSKSEYDTSVNVNSNDKILILQTCSTDMNYYEKYYRYNLLIMAKQI